MPNLKPPIVKTADAIAYRCGGRSLRLDLTCLHTTYTFCYCSDRIVAALPPGVAFEPLMTLYLTDRTTPEDVRAAKASGIVHAIKLYPAGMEARVVTCSCPGFMTVCDAEIRGDDQQ